MTMPLCVNLRPDKFGSGSELDSSCEIWRVAAVGPVDQLGRVIHVIYDEIIAKGVRRDIGLLKEADRNYRADTFKLTH